MPTRLKCYFCGQPSNDDHHVLPVSVAEYASELSEGAFKITAERTEDLCQSCHAKFHRLVNPLRLLGLLSDRVGPMDLKKVREDYLLGLLSTDKSTPLQTIFSKTAGRFTHFETIDTIERLTKFGLIFSPLPDEYKKTGAER